MIIGIDFDGTCVRNAWPFVGESMPNCVETLRYFNERGHKLILWSCREYSEYQGINLLRQALSWFRHNKIELYAVNENPSLRPLGYPVSRKCHVDLLIDDHAIFIPRRTNGDIDWIAIRNEVDRLSGENDES
jgi:hypothetical protein